MKRLFTVLAAAALVTGTAHPAVAAERVACSNPAPNTKVCRIDEPNVTVRSENFPQVTYQPGDDVTVDAGGCVQTGGHGKTWKRYVDPQPASDQLYHGLIWLPGATNALQRIATSHQTFHVASSIAANVTFLRLGYEDDNYGDNGYWGHDDGTGDQCKNVGNAFVILTIVHHPAGTTPAPVSHRPLDLVESSFDDNGLPFDPAFAYESGGVLRSTAALCPNGLQQCTSQPLTFDLPSTVFDVVPRLCTPSWSQPFTKQGHTNWATGTFFGKVFWSDRSWPDEDYNMWLIGGSGPFAVPLTSGNTTTPLHGSTAHAIGLEYYSNETIDRFSTSWWSTWHNAVDNNDPMAHAMVDRSDAVVVGLVGLDCEHDCIAEVHPVYALAMRVPDHPTGLDRWSYFVRNEGNEGMCSSHQHWLETPSLVLRLRAPAPNLHHFTVANSEAKDDDPAITLTFDNDGGDALVIVTMPHQNQVERLNGVLDLRWTP